MPFWNNNDREESKPQYLNKTEKRQVVRTVRGWEMPLMGSAFAYGFTGTNVTGGGQTAAAILTELLVCMPNDPSITGATSPYYAYGFTAGWQGLTFGSDQQDAPYFATPFNGDGASNAGWNTVATLLPGATGVSHAFLTYCRGFDSNGYPISWGGANSKPTSVSAMPGAGVGYQYGVNAYGVSTLGGLTGVTAYIKIQANDTNLSQSLAISLSGGAAVGASSGIYFYTANALTGGSGSGTDFSPSYTFNSGAIPQDVYKVFFGPTGDKNGRVAYRQDTIGVLVVAGATAVGNKTIRLTVRDNSTNDGAYGSLTGATGYTTFTLLFDRAAGLTIGGASAATADTSNSPSISQYYWANTSTIRI